MPMLLQSTPHGFVDTGFSTYIWKAAGDLGIPHTEETAQYVEPLILRAHRALSNQICMGAGRDLYRSLEQYSEYLRVRGNPALIAASLLTDPSLLEPFRDKLKESIDGQL